MANALWSFVPIMLFADVMVGFEAIRYTYSEGVGSASITIIKVGDTNFNTTVSLSTFDGTAVGKNFIKLILKE